MNPWPFVTAAYLLTLVASAAIALAAYRAMCRAEAAADQTRRRDSN